MFTDQIIQAMDARLRRVEEKIDALAAPEPPAPLPAHGREPRDPFIVPRDALRNLAARVEERERIEDAKPTRFTGAQAAHYAASRLRFLAELAVESMDSSDINMIHEVAVELVRVALALDVYADR